MSREILFKYVIERDNIKHLSREYELGEDGLPSHEDVLEDMEGECICDLNESNPCCDGSCMEWDGAVVVDKLQYTGLKDKNGVEIYEGDIAKSSIGWSVEIKFSNGSFGYHDNIGQWLPLCTWANLCFLEVIGNIHTHPDLLKG